VSLGERCDAIVRLIDESLADLRATDAPSSGPQAEETARIAPFVEYRRARAAAARTTEPDHRDEADRTGAGRAAAGI
jgi:hypothetical protein